MHTSVQLSNAPQQKLFLEDKVQLTVETPLHPALRATEEKIIWRQVLTHLSHSTKNGHYGGVIKIPIHKGAQFSVTYKIALNWRKHENTLTKMEKHQTGNNKP